MVLAQTATFFPAIVLRKCPRHLLFQAFHLAQGAETFLKALLVAQITDLA